MAEAGRPRRAGHALAWLASLSLLAPLAPYALLAACSSSSGGKGSTTPLSPEAERPIETAGTSSLAALPAGASAVLEIDLRRLRQNPRVGPTLVAFLPTLRTEVPGAGALAIDPLVEADLLVAAVYELAGARPVMVVLVHGGFDAAAVVEASPDTATLDAHTFVFGPPAWRAAAQAAAAGEAPALAADPDFRALRDRAMPVRAPGAAVRLTSRLDRDARIAAANTVGVDQVPATISLWLDVADDLALIAFLGADDLDGARALAAAVDDALVRLSAWPRFGRLFRVAESKVSGTDVRVMWYVGPKALAKALGEGP